MSNKRDELKVAAEADLEVFIQLVHPLRLLGSVHKEVIRWWSRDTAKSHQLLLLPRDHMKSALTAYRVAWTITRRPDVRILYLSSTANLATKQLKFIKDILTSDIYRKYWPEMVNVEEGRREKWTETEISIDHPLRAKEAVRDPTIFTGGMTTAMVGLHCDVAVLDDTVTGQNAFTSDGREKVKQQYSLLASIEAAEAEQWVAGTRYFPTDLYNDMLEMNIEEFNEGGDLVRSEPLYETFERQVEDMGDGTGEFLWPRQQRFDGKYFGFNRSILSTKRAQYLDSAQFRAQYYNNPNDPENAPVDSDTFQYYDKSFLDQIQGQWFYKTERLNVFASIDFAFSLGKRSDFTCLLVVGVDSSSNFYVLDIARFKTTKISEYFRYILAAHTKWGFRKIRAEVTAGQKVIVKDLKDNYIRVHGLSLAVEEFKPTRYMGSKAERVGNILEPRYSNGQIWHYRGGNCQVLEEELVMSKPPHDDVKDALATCIDMCVPPSRMVSRMRQARVNINRTFHPRFGGFG
jgi:hypothetical protein